ncbi:putative secondary metabolism biosynthetic enzyme [Exophiala oligosperma]
MATPSGYKYTDIVFEIRGQIGMIKFNRPKSLNSLGGNLRMDILTALRELNEHPDTVFTVITGEGRFFCSGADVLAAKKVAYMARFSEGIMFEYAFLPASRSHHTAVELMRSMINHKKVLVVALNGPAVGAGAAWFPPVADILLASTSSYLQTPFSQLGLVPEFGSAIHFASSTGVHRSNDFFMFGRKCSVEELAQWGIVNRVFPVTNFHQNVQAFLEEQLRVNDGKSMMEVKRLQNGPLRDQRLLAVHEAADALAERFVEDAPTKRFQQQRDMLRGEFALKHCPMQFTIRKLTDQ